MSPHIVTGAATAWTFDSEMSISLAYLKRVKAVSKTRQVLSAGEFNDIK